jgi:hypothetical protein
MLYLNFLLMQVAIDVDVRYAKTHTQTLSGAAVCISPEFLIA